MIRLFFEDIVCNLVRVARRFRRDADGSSRAPPGIFDGATKPRVQLLKRQVRPGLARALATAARM